MRPSLTFRWFTRTKKRIIWWPRLSPLVLVWSSWAEQTVGILETDSNKIQEYLTELWLTIDASRVSSFSQSSQTHASTADGSTWAPIVPDDDNIWDIQGPIECGNIPACTRKPHCLHLRTFPGGPVFRQPRHRFWAAIEIVGGGVDWTDVLV